MHNHLQDVTEDVHGLWHIILEYLCVVDSLLARSVSVEVACGPHRNHHLKKKTQNKNENIQTAHVLDFFLKATLGTILSSLEGHVFKKVGSTIVLVSLVTATSVDPHTDSSGFSVATFRCDTET